MIRPGVLVVSLCCLAGGCASTGAVPAPFPRPGGHPTRNRGRGRPERGCPGSRQLDLRHRRDRPRAAGCALPKRRHRPLGLRLQRLRGVRVRTARRQGAAQRRPSNTVRGVRSRTTSFNREISCSSRRSPRALRTSASPSAATSSCTRQVSAGRYGSSISAPRTGRPGILARGA